MTANRGQTPHVLHNMSVPPTSRVTVSRVRLSGLRFGVDLAGAFGNKGDDLRDRLAKGNWRSAWSLVGPITETLEKAW